MVLFLFPFLIKSSMVKGQLQFSFKQAFLNTAGMKYLRYACQLNI